MFDESLVTVWSAPNYCYRCGNMASILTVKENGEREFTVYDAAEENERDKGNLKNKKMVRSLPCHLALETISLTEPLLHRELCRTSYDMTRQCY